MRTLSARLLIGTAAGTALVLVLSGAGLYALMSRSLWAEFDTSLASKVRMLAAMVEEEDGRLELEFEEGGLPDFKASAYAEYYQLRSDDGTSLARSESLGSADLLHLRSPENGLLYKTTRLPDGRPGRVVAMTFVPRREHEWNDDEHEAHVQEHEREVDSLGQSRAVTLAVARETAAVNLTLDQLRIILALVCALAILASVAILAWIVRRGLRPVGHVAEQIAGVGEADLSARIRPTGFPLELMPIVDRLNELLARLEAAFNRERTFAADVAHELRTPLAGLRTTLEVSLQHERDVPAYRRAMTGCLVISEQMQQMVENLLGLARADANQLESVREDIDLCKLLNECWAPLTAKATARGLVVDWRLPGSLPLSADRGKLHLVLQNILDNAVSHADEGGRITIEASADIGRMALNVTNTGSRLTQDQAAGAFERFWMGDRSRRSTGEHCGLGLALCRKMISVMDGSITASSTPGGEFTVSIIL